MEENNKTESTKNNSGLSRRDLLKGIITVPVLGAFAYGAAKKFRLDTEKKNNLRQVVDLSSESPESYSYPNKDRKIRVGLIGYGIRGTQLMKGAGFAHPDMVDAWKTSALANSGDKRYSDFLEQENLNIEVTAVSDLFTVYAKRASEAASNVNREGLNGKYGKPARIYPDWRELVASPEVDAVIIATPDHWHAGIAMEAARNGKHVYVEKGMTRNIQEAFDLRQRVRETGIVFQLGHQGRQTESYLKAEEAIAKGIIGKVNLIEVCTNRNSPNGAWVYDIHPEGNENTIDWKTFEEPCETRHNFSLERFFRWRCWWDYGTGLSGDLLTHEFDAMNQILHLGIPHSAVSSGGVYFFKNKEAGHYINEVRDVPDVWQVALEYPEKDLTLLYSASLASNMNRGKMIMGHDGYMELSDSLTVYADRESTKYRDKIEAGKLDPDLPVYTYIPGRNNVDGIATATEQYFASRGLLYTYRGGKRVDTTHLHIKEWIEAIRETMDTGKTILPSCNIEQGFEEAIAAHMATIAYRENRKVFWDSVNEKVI